MTSSARASHNQDGHTAPPSRPEAESVGHDVSSGDARAELAALLSGRRLTPVQRRLAQYVTEHHGQVAALGAGELAERTGVSQPSVTRFAQALGFEGYPGLRRWLRELRTDGPSTSQRHVAEGAPEVKRLQQAVADEVANLQYLEAQLMSEPTALSRAGTRLTGSPVLPIIGLRASAAIVEHVRFFAAKIHGGVRTVTHAGSMGADTLEQCASAGATAALVIALPRYPRETIELLRQARKRGLWVAAITDTVPGPVHRDADVALQAPVGDRLVFDSHAAAALMAGLLLDAMAEAGGTQAQRRLEAFERHASEQQAFWPH